MSTKYAFTKGLKEVRFLFCQTSDHSAATRYRNILLTPQLSRRLTKFGRSFLTRAYPTMKKNNPHTPIMLREALGYEPRIFARYGTLLDGIFLPGQDTYTMDTELGKEKQESLSGRLGHSWRLITGTDSAQGLTDGEIEAKVSSLVRTGIS